MQVAYGCQCSVAVVDPISVQVVQTLQNGHSAVVTQCVFQSCSPASRPGIRLVSGDAHGRLVVWDVTLGERLVRSFLLARHLSRLIPAQDVPLS